MRRRPIDLWEFPICRGRQLIRSRQPAGLLSTLCPLVGTTDIIATQNILIRPYRKKHPLIEA